MTIPELANTIATLSGGSAKLDLTRLPADVVGNHGFDEDSPLSVGSAEPMVEVLVGIAPAVRLFWLSKTPCRTADEQCATELISHWGPQVFRRPLTSAEAGFKLDVYRESRRAWNATHLEALDQLVASFLLSPYFLYHAERVAEVARVNTSSGWVALDDYELASRLSYGLWLSMPDATLFELASQGRLSDPTMLATQAERMMRDEQFAQAIEAFVDGWGELKKVEDTQKDANRFPQFSKSLASDFARESRVFARKVLFEGSGSFAEFLTADHTYVNTTLAGFYGTGAVAETGWSRVALNPTERSGFLTQAAYLAYHALPAGNSPPRRAKAVLDRVLCASIPPPPQTLTITIPPEMPGVTVRESFTRATQPSQCSGCHASLNAVGFSFEKYDAIGRIQTADQGQPIDARVEFEGTSFAGAPALLRGIIGRPQVAECVGTQWFRFALARQEGADEKTTLARTAETFGQRNLDVRAYLATLVQTNSFRFRRAAQGEAP
jgi:hypothetical protein